MSTTDTPIFGVHADSWSADKYNAVASFVYSNEFTAPVFALLNAQPGERILDLGCGSGDLTTQLAKLVGEAGVVLGVDSSTSMVEKARQNGVSACFVGDAQDLHLPPSPSVASEISASLPASFDYTFDAVFTNAALHWCKRDPRSVAVGVARILREKGRFVGEMGGFTNCIGLRMAIHTVMRRHGYDPAALDPWYFPSIEDYKQVLESAGLRVTHLSLTPRLTPLSSDVVGWLRTFCRTSFFASLGDTEAESVMQEVQELCAIDCRDESGRWALMYTRLRFVAVKNSDEVGS